MKKFLRFVISIIIIASCIFSYARYVEPKWLDSSSTTIQSKKITKPQKIVAFGDTHIGHYFTIDDLTQVVKKINAENADAVVFLGDLFDNYSFYNGDSAQISAILATINCKTKLAVVGNHDVGGGASRIYVELMLDAGFTLLRNSSQAVGEICFIGADEGIFYHPNVTGLAQPDMFNFILSHEPDVSQTAGAFDFFISGHTHGGQIKFPFVGALIKPPMGKFYTNGLYQTENGPVFVNRGIGTTQMPLRFLSRPELSIIHIVPEK